MRTRWKAVDNSDPETCRLFPYAIVKGQDIIALVKKQSDAKFIAGAPAMIEGLESDSSRNRAMYLGATAQRGS